MSEMDEMGDRDVELEPGEERAIWEALESGLAQGEPTDELRREYAELVGLLPYALEPQEPSEHLTARLLAAVRQDQREDHLHRSVRQLTLAHASRRKWMMPLAAGLMLWMGGVSFWLYRQAGEQKSAIAQLTQQLSTAEARTARLVSMQEKYAWSRANLALVTAPGVGVCSLGRASEDAPAAARGALYVASDHQHWYMMVEGLEPSAEGYAYQLWFVSQGVPVSGGTFEPRPGAPVELASDKMPPDVDAVSITLEPREGATRPTGPEILFGDEMVQVL